MPLNTRHQKFYEGQQKYEYKGPQKHMNLRTQNLYEPETKKKSKHTTPKKGEPQAQKILWL